MKDKLFYGTLIAGTHSSAGKTTWALALMALARRKGLTVQPFKAGPDYIDPSFHHEICHPRRSRNLDLFLLSKEYVQETFETRCSGADVAIAEGMMGLFDGKGPSGEEGSSAQIAKVLGLPVLLVIDGAGLATSAAAMVLGFQQFDPSLNLAGVLINRVNTEGHFRWLKQAIESRTGLPCLGFLPTNEDFKIPERHLGLTTAAETREKISKLEHAADWLEKNFDWAGFLECVKTNVIARRLPIAPKQSKAEIPASRTEESPLRMTASTTCRIAVAYDQAFSFYYEDNFDLLRHAGAELVFFSPLKDQAIPEDCSLLYFGGGFPEIYAGSLSENRSMMESIRSFHQAGGLFYAECGGLIYLAEAFASSKGKQFPLLGLIPGEIQMTERLQHFGYHEIQTASESFLFSQGKQLKSHEFHYSTWQHPEISRPAYQVQDRTEGFVSEQIFATYQHLHFGSEASIAPAMVRAARTARISV